MQAIKEKGAFLCVIAAINRLLSCPSVQDAITLFLETKPYNEYAMSNERLFYWTFLLREEYSRVVGIQAPSLEFLNEYYAPNKLTKDVWGPYHWRMLHLTLIRVKMENGVVPPATRKYVKAFVTCVGLLLPCPSCKNHAWQYFTENSIDDYLTTNFHMFQWSIKFHNSVNERLNQETGSQKRIYTPDEALRLYLEVPADADFSSKWK
jgi:hypothetical protein